MTHRVIAWGTGAVGGENVATTSFLFHPRRLPGPERDRLTAPVRCRRPGSRIGVQDPQHELDKIIELATGETRCRPIDVELGVALQ